MPTATRNEDAPAGACELTVYYDGSCPVCSREIAFYRGRPGSERIEWVDASRCESAQLGDGLDRAQALARFHVRDSGGALVSGAAGFARIWRLLPGLRLLGTLASPRPVAAVLDVGYALFLRLRRLWRRPA